MESKILVLLPVESWSTGRQLMKTRYRSTWHLKEADLTKKQIKMVHKTADDLPKKDFKDRYGKEKGDAVRYATATNMVKKKLGMKEEEQIDEVFMDAYVITFSYRGDKDRSVVVFKKEHDKDIYVDFIKKKGGKVHSVKKRNLNMKV